MNKELEEAIKELLSSAKEVLDYQASWNSVYMKALYADVVWLEKTILKIRGVKP